MLKYGVKNPRCFVVSVPLLTRDGLDNTDDAWEILSHSKISSPLLESTPRPVASISPPMSLLSTQGLSGLARIGPREVNAATCEAIYVSHQAE